MTTEFRVTVVLDYSTDDDDADPDVFHDNLRDHLENQAERLGITDDDGAAFRLDTVREIEVEVLED